MFQAFSGSLGLLMQTSCCWHEERAEEAPARTKNEPACVLIFFLVLIQLSTSVCSKRCCYNLNPKPYP